MGLGIDLSTLLIGAIIAGIVGVIAGILTALFNSKYEDINYRRREHFKAHIKNLDLIKREVSSILGEAFPPWKSGFDSDETPWLGKYPGWNRKDLEEIKINDIQRVMDFRFSEFPVKYQFEQNSTVITIQDRASSNLIMDLANHFPNLSKKINQCEELIKKDGANLLTDFYVLCDLIYKILEEKGYVRIATGSNPAYSKDELPVSTIVTVVFNKSLNIPKEDWPNTYRTYTGWQSNYQAYMNELNDVANTLSSMEIVKEIVQLMDDIERKKQEINKEIDRTAQITKLPNKCFYLK